MSHTDQLDSATQYAHYQPMPPYAVPAKASNVFSDIGIALGALSFLIFPIFLGPIGIIIGAIGKSKNEPRAIVAITVSILGTLGGIFLTIVLAALLGSY